MVLSETLVTERRLGWELAAQMVEVARGQSCEGYEVEDRRKRREEHSVPHAEAGDDAGIVWEEPQEGGVACAGGIGTTAEDSAENTVAWAAPSVDGNIDNLVVASCSVAWVGRAYRVVDDYQAWAFARKARPRSDSWSTKTWQRLPQCIRKTSAEGKR
jgi:hypothetical protein